MNLITAFNEIPLASLMLVIAIGWAVGRREVRGLSLSPAGGTLFVAMLKTP